MADTTTKILQILLRMNGVDSFQSESEKAKSLVNSLAGSIGSKLKGAIIGLTGGYVGLRGAMAAIDWTREATGAERLGFAWENVNQKARTSSGLLLDSMRDAANRTVSEVNMKLQGVRANIMGIPMKDLPRLMEISKAAAKGMGQSTTAMFESIVMGIARQSRLILDNLGIIVEEEKIYKEETKRLGRELTDTERRQVFLSEVLKQGSVIINKMGKDSNVAADKIDRFDAAWQNFKTGAGSLLSGPATPLLEFFTDLFNAASKSAGSIKENTAAIEDLDKAARSLIDNPQTPNEMMFNLLLPQMEAASASLAGMRREYEATNSELLAMWSEGAKFSAEETNLLYKYAELQERIKNLQIEINKAKKDEALLTVEVIGSAEEGYRDALGLKKLFHDLGAVTTAEMIRFLEQQKDQYKNHAEILKDIDKNLHDYRQLLTLEEEQAKIESMRRVEALNMKFWLELKKRIREIASTTPSLGGGGEGINGVGAGSNTGIGAGGLKMDFGTFTSEINALSTEAISKIKSIGYVFLDVMNGILDGLQSAGVEIADWVLNIADGINAAASGDIRGVVASVVHAITSPFTQARDRERQRAEDQRRSIEALTREIDANIDSIDQMTEAEKRRRKEALEAEIQRLRLEMETRGFTGREREGALSNIANYQRELNALMGEFADDTALRGLKSLKDVIGYITGQETDLTYNAASGIAGHFSQMFNLSLEEQMALWGTIRDTLIANGNYTIDQLWQIDETLKGLKDQIAEEKKRARESGVQSQIYRSVTTITESQANVMVAVLNTISAYVREILETLRESLNQLPRPAAVTGGAGNINIYGPITVKANDPKAFVDAFVAEARGRGFKAA